MRHLLFHLLLLILMLPCTLSAQENPYLGQTPPQGKAEVFAPGLISKEGVYEFGSVFNRAGTEFYFALNVRGRSEIHFSRLEDGVWSKPVAILSHPVYGYNDPFLSRDEQRLYFISRRPLSGEGEPKDYDIWYVERRGAAWSEPINAGAPINTPANEYYISFTEDGAMYFGSNRTDHDFDIYRSAWVEGSFQEPVNLGTAVNSEHYEADVFVDPNESYIIFCAERPDGYGRGDLYISFKKIGGGWSKAMNMGPEINTNGHELCPYVSPDGAYFFYTSRQDIYWISAEVIEELRAKS